MESLNNFYELAVLIEFHALSDVLDIVCCYNVEIIPLIDKAVS